MTRSRRAVPAVLLRALLTVCGVIVLASCASVPSSGPVVISDREGFSPEDQSIRVLARPPREGASQTDVVDGFLAASATFERDHAVAREYLTAAASESWDPGAGVTVYDAVTPTTTELTTPTDAVFESEAFVGTIGAKGEFEPNERRVGLSAPFVLERVDSEWRISSVPSGLILSNADVQRAFRPANLFFPAESGEVLVPDSVYVAAERAQLLRRIVDGLVEGPTAWLAPVVRTAFPEGTRVVDVGRRPGTGIFDVELSSEALSADAGQRRLLLGQLAYTLRQLPEFTAVSVEVGGLPFAAPGLDGVVRPADLPALDPVGPQALVDRSAYALTNGKLNILEDEDQRPVEGYFGRGQNLVAAAVALDGGLQGGSFVDANGSSVVGVSITGRPVYDPVHSGTDVDELSFDRDRALWFVDHAPDGDELWLHEVGGTSVRVPVEGLGARRIESFRVAPDGARAALVVVDGDDPPELMLARITGGDTREVQALRRIENVFAEATDVSWAGVSTLFVLGRETNTALQAYTVGAGGGTASAAGSVPGMTNIAAAPERARLAATDDGVIWSDVGGGWRQYARGQEPIYPG